MLKNFIKYGLLAFVFFSLGVAFQREFSTVSTGNIGKPDMTELEDNRGTEKQEKIIVYYFHGTKRCRTCYNFEKYTTEVLESEFADSLGNSAIELKVINIDTPSNTHYVSDYKLYSKSIIISKLINGKETKWKNAEKIWDYANKQIEFKKYLKDSLEYFIGEDDG